MTPHDRGPRPAATLFCWLAWMLHPPSWRRHSHVHAITSRLVGEICVGGERERGRECKSKTVILVHAGCVHGFDLTDRSESKMALDLSSWTRRDEKWAEPSTRHVFERFPRSRLLAEGRARDVPEALIVHLGRPQQGRESQASGASNRW